MVSTFMKVIFLKTKWANENKLIQTQSYVYLNHILPSLRFNLSFFFLEIVEW